MATLRAVRLSDSGVAAWGEWLADGVARDVGFPRALALMLRSAHTGA